MARWGWCVKYATSPNWSSMCGRYPGHSSIATSWGIWLPTPRPSTSAGHCRGRGRSLWAAYRNLRRDDAQAVLRAALVSLIGWLGWAAWIIIYSITLLRL
jgi:hypothetical protein